ncbi:MAG: hypothetical protein QOG67_3647 [Verrucomicrobiota bacterium]
MHEHTGTDEIAAVHGMLVVGDSEIFMSHLPMFHAPHDFQVFLEVSLSEEQADPTAVYREDRMISREPIYTWVPKPFVLSGLLSSTQEPAVMTGTLFRGHFERAGTPITSDKVSALVTRVLYSRRLIASDERPAQLRYLLFGSTAEPFVAHWLTRPPDFDHIASASVGRLPADWDGTALQFELPNRQDSADQRLKSGERLLANITDFGPSGAVNMTVKDEFYFETGDLAS